MQLTIETDISDDEYDAELYVAGAIVAQTPKAKQNMDLLNPWMFDIMFTIPYARAAVTVAMALKEVELPINVDSVNEWLRSRSDFEDFGPEQITEMAAHASADDPQQWFIFFNSVARRCEVVGRALAEMPTVLH